MFRIFSLLLIVLGSSLQISAQCGAYFKETKRQVFSDSFANGYFEDFDNDGLEDLLGYSLTQTTSGGQTSIQIQYYKRLSETSFDTVARISLIPGAVVWFGAFGLQSQNGRSLSSIYRERGQRLPDGVLIFSGVEAPPKK